MCFVIWKKSNKIWKRKIYDKREKKKKKKKRKVNAISPQLFSSILDLSLDKRYRSIFEKSGDRDTHGKAIFFFLNRSIEKTRRKKPRCSVSNNRIESSRAIYDAVYFRKCSHSALKKRRNVASSRCFSSFYCF